MVDALFSTCRLTQTALQKSVIAITMSVIHCRLVKLRGILSAGFLFLNVLQTNFNTDASRHLFAVDSSFLVEIVAAR